MHRTWRLAIGCGLLAAAVLIASAPASGATTEQVEFTAKYSKRDRNKERGGLSLRTRFTITDPAAPAPLQLTRTVLRFPKGAVVNGRNFPKCKIAELRARGPKACPRGSKLGSGTARGAAPPIVDNVDAKVTLYNGAGGGGNPSVIIYSIPDLGPIITLEGAIEKDRNGPYGYVLDVAVPPIKTLPNAPDASVTFFDVTTRDLTVRRRGRTIHYIEGPVLCDGTFFLLDGAFSYQGGVTHTVYERFTLDGGPRCR
jgi:hypothetical protein